VFGSVDLNPGFGIGGTNNVRAHRSAVARPETTIRGMRMGSNSSAYKKEMTEPEKPQSQAGKPMAIPSDMKAFNDKVIADFRAHQGQFTGSMAGRSVLILTTTGARSGKERTAVLGYGRDGDRLVVIASANGAPVAPNWYHNLLAHPIATVELGPEPFKVRARTARPEERDDLAKALPYLKQQQGLTERELPIVVLERQ